MRETEADSKRILMSYMSSPINIDSRKNATLRREKGEFVSQRISR